VDGTRHLLEAAGRAGLQRLVYRSSVANLGVPCGDGHREDDLANEEAKARLEQMMGHYKRSKYLAEQAVLAAARDGLPVVVVNHRAPRAG
jgi:dihydroflavonol-4-reductase